MNTELKNAKNHFEIYFFKLISNSVFGKTMENVRKLRDIKLVTTEARRNCLGSEPNYHSTKLFSKKLSDIALKRTQIFMNKSVYLGLSILEISKIVIYEFWYDCMKQKMEKKQTYVIWIQIAL